MERTEGNRGECKTNKGLESSAEMASGLVPVDGCPLIRQKLVLAETLTCYDSLIPLRSTTTTTRDRPKT